MTKTETGATPEKAALTPTELATMLQTLAEGMSPDTRVRTLENLKSELWKQISNRDIFASIDALERAEAASKAARAARGSKR